MSSTTDQEQDNRELVRTLVREVWNRGNYERVPELIHPEYVLEEAASPLETRGVSGFVGRAETYHTAFPDLELAVEDLVVEGDRVVLRWTARGTHSGPLFGVPPTGATVALTGITIYRIEDGKVRRSWEVSDTLGLRRQLGLTFPGILTLLPRLLWRKAATALSPLSDREP